MLPPCLCCLFNVVFESHLFTLPLSNFSFLRPPFPSFQPSNLPYHRDEEEEGQEEEEDEGEEDLEDEEDEDEADGENHPVIESSRQDDHRYCRQTLSSMGCNPSFALPFAVPFGTLANTSNWSAV